MTNSSINWSSLGIKKLTHFDGTDVTGQGNSLNKKHNLEDAPESFRKDLDALKVDMHESYDWVLTDSDSKATRNKKLKQREEIADLFSEILSSTEKEIATSDPKSPKEYREMLQKLITDCTNKVAVKCSSIPLANATSRYLRGMVCRAMKLDLEHCETDGAGYRAIFDLMCESSKSFHNEMKPELRALGNIYHIPWIELSRQNLFTSVDEAYFRTNLASFGLNNDFDFDLYKSAQVGYKGGFARTILKMYLVRVLNKTVNPKELACAIKGLGGEIPLNDIDALVPKVTAGLIDKLYSDPEGIEVYTKLWSGDFLDGLISYFDSRDMTANELLLIPGNGLYFTQACVEDTLTGTIRPSKMGREPFGTNSFHAKVLGEYKEFLGQKSLFRLMNPVLGSYKTDGKSVIRNSKFKTIKIEEKQLFPNDMGIYWLILLRKCLPKHDGMEKMVQMHDLALQLGGTTISCPITWWRSLLEKYSSFKINDRGFDDKKLLLWFSAKVFRYTYKELRAEYRLSKNNSQIEYSDLKELTVRDERTYKYLVDNKCELESFLNELKKMD